ncbi:MAG TPA: SurA N-terminal domain-containing protein [Burkholderiales bacterium]|jgi:peptidyl-prolyl cis-trans isomerase D|nr:SurA N-terminal domain-containing protein [Burkholderiales bacterium]
MFDFTHKHKKLIQIVLFVIFLPFAFFGVDSYFHGREGAQTVATVGSHEISRQEFARALQDRQRSIQRMLQGRVDPAMLDSAEVRNAALEGLIQRRLLLDRALRSGMAVSDQYLQTAIADLPVFHGEGGKFSLERYRQFLKSESESEVSFETRLRQDLILQQLTEAYAESAFVPRTVTERVARLAEQQREVSQLTIRPDQFAAAVRIEPEAARKYYEANRGEFDIPEQVRLEYVVLSLEELMKQAQFDPAEVPKYYESRRSQLEKAETQARHILIAVDAAAGADAKNKAKAAAEDLYKQLKQRPAAFPELAKAHSQDPGSAANGGDLGFITRGSMKDVPEFEAALFKLKQGEISPPVESKLGFHIIQATEVRGARGKSLEEMRPEIEAELKKQAAARTFAEVGDKFNNTVYEQSESLKPAAELAKTSVRQSGWTTRARAADALLNHPRLLQAVFSEDVLKNKRNTEAVEVAPGTIVAARVIEHKPASVRPFEEVKGLIEKKLVLREAVRLAAQEGKSKLDSLKQGKETSAAWGAPQLVTRSDLKGLPETVVRQAFKVDAAALPAYAGVADPEGSYTILKITRVIDVQDIPADRREAFAEALRRTRGQEELTAYVASLRQKTGVKISKDVMEKKER